MASTRRSRLANEITVFDDAEDETQNEDVEHASEQVENDIQKLLSIEPSAIPHDRVPSPPEDPYDHSHQESTDDEPSFNDEDPFSESEVNDNDEGFADEEDSFDSHGYGDTDPIKAITYQVSHNYDRSFSTTTAIHLDDPDHPGHHDSTDERISLVGERMRMLCDTSTLVGDSRKLSDGFSTLPDDLDVPHTPSKQHRNGIYSPSPRHGSTPRERLLSQQLYEHELNTPTRDRLLSSTRARQGSSQRRPVFRNPSSVRAMQMSSPPPFSNSPRSARQRRMGSAMSMSQDGSPASRRGFQDSSPRHPNPRKEYPLMLLHCSVSISPLPYAFTTLQAVLPPATLENLALLKEKIGPIILERGLLVPHPGDDYELLEERVLETLELKTPRIGKCGHFAADILKTDGQEGLLGDGPKANTNVAADEYLEMNRHLDGAGPCDDCKSHVAPELLGQMSGSVRRWDIKVYAANGLMRAGAWGTAWREMEKIDLEVGVFIPDELRRQLDAKAAQEGTEIGEFNPDSSDQDRDQDLRRTFEAPMPPPMVKSRSIGADAASTAACSRPPSRHTQKGNVSRKTSRQISQSQTPLSTLLVNYVQHKIRDKPEVFIGVIILLLGVLFSGRSFLAATSPAGVNMESSSISIEVPLAAAEVTAEIPATVSQEVTTTTVTEEVEVTTAGWQIPACTFSPGELGAHEMTALPEGVARSVLEALAMSTPSPSSILVSSSTNGEDVQGRATSIVHIAEDSVSATPESTPNAGEDSEPGLVEKVMEFVSGGDDGAEME